ncbi:MAG: hypothetical protein R3F38_12415 [Gammaproteobacteria bacterium]
MIELKTTPVDSKDSPLVGAWFAEAGVQSPEGVQKDRLLVQVTPSGYVSYHYLGCDQQLGSPLGKTPQSAEHANQAADHRENGIAELPADTKIRIDH